MVEMKAMGHGGELKRFFMIKADQMNQIQYQLSTQTVLLTPRTLNPFSHTLVHAVRVISSPQKIINPSK
jgi:hypothetical protein